MLLDAVFRHQGTATLSRSGTVLRPVVRGGSGGVIASLAIVAGVAGAQGAEAGGLGALAVVVTGLASLLANALAVGVRGVLGGKAQRDLYRAEQRRMMERMTEDPRRGREAVEAILVDGGLDEDSARDAAAILIRSPDMASDLILSREFELTTPRATAPVRDGLIAGAGFAVLGVAPLLPYLLGGGGEAAFTVSVALAGLMLGLLGTLRWRATGEPLLRALGEPLLAAGLAGTAAYGVGNWIAG